MRIKWVLFAIDTLRQTLFETFQIKCPFLSVVFTCKLFQLLWMVTRQFCQVKVTCTGCHWDVGWLSVYLTTILCCYNQLFFDTTREYRLFHLPIPVLIPLKGTFLIFFINNLLLDSDGCIGKSINSFKASSIIFFKYMSALLTYCFIWNNGDGTEMCYKCLFYCSSSGSDNYWQDKTIPNWKRV